MGSCLSINVDSRRHTTTPKRMPSLRKLPPKGSFPSIQDQPSVEGSFPAAECIAIDKPKPLRRRRLRPTYSLGTKYKYVKACFTRKVHPFGGSALRANMDKHYSVEWAALMGLPSGEEDEVPLMEFMDEHKDGYYF